jgi:hypothetical protein
MAAKEPKQEVQNGHENGQNGSADDGWQDVKTDLLMYKFDNEHCKKTRLEGYLLDRVRMPDVKGRQPPEWWCYHVRLTAPCTLVDREDKPHAGKPGDECWAPASAKIDQAFKVHALNPRAVLPVRITFTGTQKLDGGKKLNLFDFQANVKRARPRAGFCLPPVGDSGFNRQMGQGAIDTTGEETPF